MKLGRAEIAPEVNALIAGHCKFILLNSIAAVVLLPFADSG